MENKNTGNGEIYHGSASWEKFLGCIKNLNPSRIFVVTDENTYTDCVPYFLKQADLEIPPEIVVIPAGEKYKSIATCLYLWETLSKKGADRSSLIVNLGGGVVTDLGGFVASTFMRGIAFINIPTSLLGMVDASVGGKNGVDLGALKNQIGVIKLPEIVVLDYRFLTTLPREHYISGFAEMLKHGLIHDRIYWDRLINTSTLNGTENEALIWDSIEIKKSIVALDPSEKNVRKTLNYGHTLGHAIESYFLKNIEKTTLLHGEAVAAGMVLETYISCEFADFPKETLHEVSTVIFSHFPKQEFSKNDIDAIIELLAFDKKRKNGQVLFVLLQDIGRPRMDCLVTNDLIYNAFNYYKNF